MERGRRRPRPRPHAAGGAAALSAPAARIVVIGNAALDEIFNLRRLPQIGETVVASGVALDIGGKGLNQAVAAARAGATVTFCAAIGDDGAADLIRRTLAQEGLDPSELRQRSGATDRSVISLLPAGENCIVSATGQAESLRPADVAPALDRLAPGDLLLLQGNLVGETTAFCIAQAARRRARVVVNPSPIREDFAPLWPDIDVLVVNDIECRQLAGEPDTEQAMRSLRRKGSGVVVATRGRDGACLATADGMVPVVAPAVAAIDTAGAGDVFCGTFAAGLALGLEARRSAAWAVAAASLSVTRSGTYRSFPSRAELAALRPSQAASAP